MIYVPVDSRYDAMIYRRCGRSGLLLPVISLGLWHNFGGVDTLENARHMIHRAFDLGITHFDLANNYGPPPGSAEENFGKIFAQDLRRFRDELIISTKAGYRMWPGPYGEWGSRKNLLGTPCLIHQPVYSMLNRWVEDGLLDTLNDEGIGCISFSPLAQGMLTNKYLSGVPDDSRAAKSHGFLRRDTITEERLDTIRGLNQIADRRGQSLAQMAIAWVLRHQGMTSALIGASRVGQIEDNGAALRNLSFSDEELVEVETLLSSANR